MCLLMAGVAAMPAPRCCFANNNILCLSLISGLPNNTLTYNIYTTMKTFTRETCTPEKLKWREHKTAPTELKCTSTNTFCHNISFQARCKRFIPRFN
jgi:hypothetical protein